MDTEFNSMFSDNMRMLSRNFDLHEDFDVAEPIPSSQYNMSPNIVNRNSVIMEFTVEEESSSSNSS